MNTFYKVFLLVFSGSILFGFTLVSSPEINLDKKDPSTKESHDGYIKVKITQGTAPYTIIINSTAIQASVVKDDHVEINNAGEGTYTFTVQDSKNISSQKTIQLTASSR